MLVSTQTLLEYKRHNVLRNDDKFKIQISLFFSKQSLSLVKTDRPRSVDCLQSCGGDLHWQVIFIKSCEVNEQQLMHNGISAVMYNVHWTWFSWHYSQYEVDPKRQLRRPPRQILTRPKPSGSEASEVFIHTLGQPTRILR